MYINFSMNKVKKKVPGFAGFKKIMNHNKKYKEVNNNILAVFGMRLKILRQMTDLSVEDYCKKYQLPQDKYMEWEQGKSLMDNETSANLIQQLYSNNEIFCLPEWIEGEKKPSPLYIQPKTIEPRKLMYKDLENFEKKIQLAYGYKSLNPNFVVNAITDSLMGSLYQKSTIVVSEKYDINNESSLNSIQNLFCVIKTHDNKSFVRKVVYSNGQFFAKSIDPIREYVFNKQDIVYIGKIQLVFNNDFVI